MDRTVRILLWASVAELLGVVALAFAMRSSGVGPDGEAITEPTILNADGTATVDGENPIDPYDLAAGMGCSVDELAMARCCASEAGGLPFIAQIGVMWTLRNYARSKGLSVLRATTIAKKKLSDGSRIARPGADGFFGAQNQGRYVATSKNSTEDLRMLARQVIAGDVDDPTGGATHFDSPQSYGVQEGTDESGADEFAGKMSDQGLDEVDLPGVSSNRIRFFS